MPQCMNMPKRASRHQATRSSWFFMEAVHQPLTASSIAALSRARPRLNISLSSSPAVWAKVGKLKIIQSISQALILLFTLFRVLVHPDDRVTNGQVSDYFFYFGVMVKAFPGIQPFLRAV